MENFCAGAPQPCKNGINGERRWHISSGGINSRCFTQNHFFYPLSSTEESCVFQEAVTWSHWFKTCPLASHPVLLPVLLPALSITLDPSFTTSLLYHVSFFYPFFNQSQIIALDGVEDGERRGGMGWWEKRGGKSIIHRPPSVIEGLVGYNGVVDTATHTPGHLSLCSPQWSGLARGQAAGSTVLH